MSRVGDWMCGACQHSNFKKRDTCQRCGFPKFGGPADVSEYLQSRTEVLAGDWYCQAINCGAHNYASRSACFRCGCIKMAYSSNVMPTGGFEVESLIPGWKSGDWICSRTHCDGILLYDSECRPGCGVHNYASRGECFRCKNPRGFGDKSWSSSSSSSSGGAY